MYIRIVKQYPNGVAKLCCILTIYQIFNTHMNSRTVYINSFRSNVKSLSLRNFMNMGPRPSGPSPPPSHSPFPGSSALPAPCKVSFGCPTFPGPHSPLPSTLSSKFLKLNLYTFPSITKSVLSPEVPLPVNGRARSPFPEPSLPGHRSSKI